MRAIIADDEPLALQRIARLLNDTEIDVIGKAVNGIEVLDLIERLNPDIVFLDIEMPSPNGLEVAERIQNLDKPPIVIFLTAHSEFALEGYNLSVSGYLLKPVDSDDIAKLLDRLAKESKLVTSSTLDASKWISYQCGHSLRRVPLDDVFYLCADGKYVKMHFKAGEALLDSSLSEYEVRLSETFLRIHRRFLVNISKIIRLDINNGQHCLYLNQYEEPLMVSRRKVSVVKEVLEGKLKK